MQYCYQVPSATEHLKKQENFLRSGDLFMQSIALAVAVILFIYLDIKL